MLFKYTVPLLILEKIIYLIKNMLKNQNLIMNIIVFIFKMDFFGLLMNLINMQKMNIIFNIIKIKIISEQMINYLIFIMVLILRMTLKYML